MIKNKTLNITIIIKTYLKLLKTVKRNHAFRYTFIL